MSPTAPGEQAVYELSVERTIHASPGRVYKVWTERLAEWWCPAPWSVADALIDLRAGGQIEITMCGPGGEQEDLAGVILEVIPNQLIVFTNAFLVGWIPQTPFMVGHFEFMTVKSGTLYKATSRHWDLETQQKHIDIGFNEGWTTVAKQLAALAEAY